MVFMMGPQFRLTGPSLSGMSTELPTGESPPDNLVFRQTVTYSNQFFTSSNWALGMELM